MGNCACLLELLNYSISKWMESKSINKRIDWSPSRRTKVINLRKDSQGVIVTSNQSQLLTVVYALKSELIKILV